jgi:hypothetical protein
MILSWSKRPIEVARLLNPAFCAIMIHESISGYKQENNTGMPFALSFLILPLVLHKPTREILPRDIRTKLHNWIHQNQDILVGLDTRIQQLVPYTREAIYIGLQSKILLVSENGFIDSVACGYEQLGWMSTSEPAMCKKKANFIGRWFSRVGDTATIFAILGVRP